MIQSRITQVLLSKQVSLGSPAASGDYRIGVKSGQVATVDIAEDGIGQTWSSRINEGQDRGDVNPGSSFETVAMRKSLGLLLLAALGTDTPSGSSPARSHVFTVGDVLPYLTVHSRKGAEYHTVGDCRLDELEISWEGVKAVTASATFMGCSIAFGGTSEVGAVADERPKDGVLKGCGGTFTVDGQTAIIKSGSVTISNGLSQVHGSGSPLPSDVYPAGVTISFSLVIVPADTTLFRRVVTGTTNGTVVQCRPVIGTASCSFSDGTHTLELASDQLAFMTSFPDTSAEGGPVEVTLEGTVVAGSNAFKATLVNDVTNY